MTAKSKKPYHEAESPKSEKSGFSLSALRFKLGYDGKRAANNFTGLGNYSRSLIEQLAIEFPDNSYFVYTPKINKAVVALPLFSLPNVNLVCPKSKGLLWRSFGIKKQLIEDRIQLFHGLSHEIPYGIAETQIKSIVTMHDLIFMRKPQYYKWIDRQIYSVKSKYACRHADRIIAISERTKIDIVDLYQIDPKKIDVIYQSCDDRFKFPLTSDELDRAKANYTLPDKYILYVGTIESRKNLLALIKALPQIEINTKLVVVGRPTAYAQIVYREIEKLGLTDRVVFLKVPFVDLPAVYQLSSVFVLPSYYEGFGIPIIEALYSKTPVVAASGSCLEEAGGPDSLYFAPDDVESLATKVNQVLSDPSISQHMRLKGFEYVQRFNTAVVNQQLISCYLKTLEQ